MHPVSTVSNLSVKTHFPPFFFTTPLFASTFSSCVIPNSATSQQCICLTVCELVTAMDIKPCNGINVSLLKDC